MPRFDKLEEFYAELDTRSEKLRMRYPWWPCFSIAGTDESAGCAECCIPSLFLVSELEFQYVMTEFVKLNKTKQREIREKSRAIVKAVRKKHGGSWFNVSKKIPQSVYPCPLLESNRCLVYTARCCSCREYGIFLIDNQKAFWCDRVEQAVREHMGDGLMGMYIKWAVKREKDVLKGESKPLAAWLADMK